MADRVTRPAAPGEAVVEQPGKGQKVRVTLRRSLIGCPEDQRRTVWALGLRRVGASRVHALGPQLAGALRKVQHLVAVEVIEGVEHDRHR